MSKISFIKSDERKYNIERCLSLIKSEITGNLKNAKSVVIKPHCALSNQRNSSTSLEVLEAVLAFIKPHTKSQIILAEGVQGGDTLTAFKNLGYFTLQEKYDFAVIDLNQDQYQTLDLLDAKGQTWPGQIAHTLLRSDYLISLSPMQFDREIVYAGAIKNIIEEPLSRHHEGIGTKLIHMLGLAKNTNQPEKELKTLHQNIQRVYDLKAPNLAIIDGYELLTDEGALSRTLPLHLAIASSDPIAADWLACQMIGLEMKEVGYLSLLEEAEEDKTDYFVVGDPWQKQAALIKQRLAHGRR